MAGTRENESGPVGCAHGANRFDSIRRNVNLHVLSEDQVEFYRGNDYLHAQGVLPGDLLQLGRKILARWADDQIAKWYEEAA